MTKSLEKHLDKLAHELQCANLWDNHPPHPDKLNSSEPFCVDTLQFEQWLQWVFIPKLHELIAMPEFSGLPNKSDIHTMADYVFTEYPQNTDNVCEAIKQVDQTLNALPRPSIH